QTDVVTTQPSASAPTSESNDTRNTMRPSPTATRSSLGRGAAAWTGMVASDIHEPFDPNTENCRLLFDSLYRLLEKNQPESRTQCGSPLLYLSLHVFICHGVPPTDSG